MKFDPRFGFGDTLKSLQGTLVQVYLRNGSYLAGKVGDVGTQFVVLTEIAGREFYDALVCLGDICAMEVRVRSE
jgi:hypothetical protein